MTFRKPVIWFVGTSAKALKKMVKQDYAFMNSPKPVGDGNVNFFSEKEFHKYKDEIKASKIPAVVGVSKAHTYLVDEAFAYGVLCVLDSHVESLFPAFLNLFSELSKRSLSQWDHFFLTNFQIYNHKIIWSFFDQLIIKYPFLNHAKVIGIYEILTNAMEHGNLGYTSSQKIDLLEKGNYYSNIEKSLKKNRKITSISFLLEEETLKIRVEDQGQGFNYHCVKTLDKESLAGRGIYIAKRNFDTLTYKGKGNVVIMTLKGRSSYE